VPETHVNKNAADRTKLDVSQAVERYVLMARIIWDRSDNPTRRVSNSLRIERWQLKEAIHRIKASRGLGPTDRVIIYDDGAVTDRMGDRIGNIYDEI
jgi:hypothetical protein